MREDTKVYTMFTSNTEKQQCSKLFDIPQIKIHHMSSYKRKKRNSIFKRIISTLYRTEMFNHT